MSVGAGSIKRAAKAAQPVQTEEKVVKQEQEVKQTESKAAGNKTVVKKAGTQPVKEKKAEGVEQKRYGVGEELPVFLM